MSSVKRNSLLFLLIAMLLILLVAMGLPNLKLSPGQPFSLGQAGEEAGGGLSALLSDEFIAWLLRGLWALAIISLPVYIFVSLFTPEGRRRLRRDVIVLLLLYLISEFLPKFLANREIIPDVQEAALPQGVEQIQQGAPTVVFSANPPPWLTVVIVILATILFSALVLGITQWLRQRKAISKTPLEQLADEAQNAMEALRAGRDFKSTIIRCYQEMGRVVAEERGIHRDDAMTPREFEAHLAGKGLPLPPVRTITRLFEKVRYGSAGVEPEEEEQALSCLSDISQACRLLGGSHEG